jgi:polyhydroxyalkanoate synthase subunit PhaC
MAAGISEPIVLEDIADAVQAGELVGGFSLPAAARSLWSAGRRSPGLGRRAASLAAETTKILLGSDGVAPKKSDWRFRDDTWRDNPAYRRLMQAYLAGCEALEEAVEVADLGWRDKERARFAAAILTSAVAPTNTLLGNPAAVKRAYETGGLSLLRGTRNFVKDVRSNRAMPSTVNRDAFAVGKDLAATPGAVIYRDDVCEVLQYAPSTSMVRSRPVLMVPPQISKYYFMDLSPGRSFVEHAVAHGLPFFVISWRNVTADQRDWGLETYAAAIDRVVDVVRDVAQSDDINLIALCAGGITTSTVLSHLAATGDPRVHSASFGVTLLDFGVPAPIGMFRMAPLLARHGPASWTRPVCPRCSAGCVPMTWSGITGSTTT